MIRQLALTTALLAASTQALAQADYTFLIDTNQTAFTWSGTTSLGDIDENPANFSLAGTTILNMSTGGNPVGSASFVGGDALVTPDIGGTIPNAFPFLPPLATFSLTNAHLQLTSTPFTVDAAGNFSGLVTMHMLQGTLTVTDLLGTVTVTDLAGTQSTPTAAGGQLQLIGSAYQLDVPIAGVFPFADAASGVTGTMTLNGNLRAAHAWAPPVSYCPGAPNSVGAGATTTASGTPSLGLGDLTLTTTGLPQNEWGIYYYGPNQINLPFGNGNRCVGGQVIRLAPINSGAAGQVSRVIDNASLPATGQLLVGGTQNFQFWYRDPADGGASFNLSSAVSVTSTP